jgi:hypothetical protein
VLAQVRELKRSGLIEQASTKAPLIITPEGVRYLAGTDAPNTSTGVLTRGTIVEPARNHSGTSAGTVAITSRGASVPTIDPIALVSGTDAVGVVRHGPISQSTVSRWTFVVAKTEAEGACGRRVPVARARQSTLRSNRSRATRRTQPRHCMNGDHFLPLSRDDVRDPLAATQRRPQRRGDPRCTVGVRARTLHCLAPGRGDAAIGP